MIRTTIKKIQLLINKLFIKPILLLIRNFITPNEKLMRKMTFIGKFRVQTFDNKSFYLYNNAFYLENSIFWLGIDNFSWEYMTRKIWIHLSKSSKTIFDIGANTGIFSILSKVYNPNALVYAFEPQPNIFEILRKNDKINKFNIVCEKIAISYEKGNFPFYNYRGKTFTKRNTTAGSLNKNWRPNNQHSIIVPVKTLKDYIEVNRVGTINLMKIDVETLEHEVLVGYGDYLNLHKPIIILEIQNEIIGGKIKSLMNSKNYSFFNIDEENGLKCVQKLGMSKENQNYLICPNSKLNEIKKII